MNLNKYREMSDSKSQAIWELSIGEYQNLLDEALDKIDEDKSQILKLLMERDSWRVQAEQRFAMRKEFEDLLGFEDGFTYGEKGFQEALRKLKGIIESSKTSDAERAVVEAAMEEWRSWREPTVPGRTLRALDELNTACAAWDAASAKQKEILINLLEEKMSERRKGERRVYRTRRVMETVTPDPNNPTAFMYWERGTLRWTPDQRKVTDRRRAERRRGE